MDREIKFRGRCVLGGKDWFYGLLGKKKTRNNGQINYSIIFESGTGLENVPVTEDSIGEFTGAYDREGKEIFENDIIEKDVDGIYSRGKVTKRYGGWYLVYFDDGFDDIFWLSDKISIKVIGNIHDNKELLECKE